MLFDMDTILVLVAVAIVFSVIAFNVGLWLGKRYMTYRYKTNMTYLQTQVSDIHDTLEKQYAVREGNEDDKRFLMKLQDTLDATRAIYKSIYSRIESDFWESGIIVPVANDEGSNTEIKVYTSDDKSVHEVLSKSSLESVRFLA